MGYPRRIMPKDKADILDYLRIKDEAAFFTLYFNYAVENIRVLTGIGTVDENQAIAEIRQKGDRTIEKLANFLWLFKVNKPEDSFPDYKDNALALTKKIFELRNFFSHSDRRTNAPLLADRSFNVLIEGQMLPPVRDFITAKFQQADKVFKLKLLTKDEDKFELTRKGLIFLCGLGLYRDQASEFCQLFDDLKLPNSRNIDEFIDPPTGAKKQRMKSLVELFTHYSYRKGRTEINAEDKNLIITSDMITYLNKVPKISMDILDLKKEHNRLSELEQASTESDENKAYKYQLHTRFEDKFLSYATAYCEDFGTLDCLKFKRLDISDNIGRSRFLFGKDEDNSVRMNRHYKIVDNAINFAYEPTEHYGAIKLNSLRSRMSCSEMKKLLHLSLMGKDINTPIEAYFKAYHAILEKMLNAEDCLELYIEHFIDELKTISNLTKEQIESDDFMELLSKFFPENILRFFIPDPNHLKKESMRRKLVRRINNNITHAECFQKRAEALIQWRNADKDSRGNIPTLSAEEVPFGERKCNLANNEMIEQVFNLFNLHLAPEDRFRQIVAKKQHRGMLDHQYQMVHTNIGKFSLDQKSLWGFLEKFKPELNDVVTNLRRKVKQFSQNENHKVNGRLSVTLLHLAQAATALYIEQSNRELKRWEEQRLNDQNFDALYKICKRYHITSGLPLDHKGLVNTILHIDLDKWCNAYDYDAHKPYENRNLADVEHVVSQIPFPNGFAERVACQPTKDGRITKCLKDGKFDFNSSFRTNIDNRIALREYYDTADLISYAKGDNPDKNGFNLESKIEYSKRGLNQAINQIKEVHNQDRLILQMALKYLAGATDSGIVDFRNIKFNEADLYSYLNTPIDYQCRGGYKLKLTFNDLSRPVLSKVSENIAVIYNSKEREGTSKEMLFYRATEDMHQIAAEDRRKSLELVPLLSQFESSVHVPAGEHANEYKYYEAKYPCLAPQEFKALQDIRNNIFHGKLGLETTEALRILKKCGIR